MSASATIADAGLKRDGRDWREMRDWQGLGSHVTRLSLLALVVRHSAISQWNRLTVGGVNSRVSNHGTPFDHRWL